MIGTLPTHPGTLCSIPYEWCTCLLVVDLMVFRRRLVYYVSGDFGFSSCIRVVVLVLVCVLYVLYLYFSCVLGLEYKEKESQG